MMTVLKALVRVGLLCCSVLCWAQPWVVIHTSQGVIRVELYEAQSPQTTANFLRYVDAGFYSNTLFHRVIPGFMIQGGGFDAQLKRLTTQAAVTNESRNQLPNRRGTLAMARTADPHSATSQFFINLADNAHLDAQGTNLGYTVFGQVVDGMAVVDRIAQTPTQPRQGMNHVPIDAVLIQRIERMDPPKQ